MADRKLYSKTTGGSVIEVGNGAVASHTHVIGDVTGLQTALDGKLSTSGKAADAGLLDGIDSARMPYALDSGSGFGALGTTNTFTTDGGIGADNISRSMFFRDNNGQFGTIGCHISHATSSAYAIQIAATSYASVAGNLKARAKNNGVWEAPVTLLDGSSASQTKAGSLTVTGGVTATLTGNASTATKLQTARTISLGGSLTGSVSFDGTANVSISASVVNNSHAHTIANVTGLQSALDLKLNAANGALTGVTTYATLSGAAANTRDKLRVWNNASHVIGMSNAFTFGDLGGDGYAMTFQMDASAQRGFWWGTISHTTGQGAMSLSNRGRLTVAESVRVGYGTSDVTDHDTGFDLDIQGPARVQGVDLVSTLNAKAPIASPSFTTAVNSPRYNVGDDAYFADINAANTVAVRGSQNADVGFINFGPGGNALGSGSGQALTFRSGGVAYHGSSTYGSAKITVSTSSPSGGVSGDIWLKV